MSDTHDEDAERKSPDRRGPPSVASIFANATARAPGGFRGPDPAGRDVQTRACSRCGSPRVGDAHATACPFCKAPYFDPEDTDR